MIEFSRVLNIASILLVIVGVTGVILGLTYLLFTPLDEELLGVTISQIRAFNPNLMVYITHLFQFDGLYLLSLCLSLCIIAVLPFRKGEKWAWYIVLIIFGFALLGQLILVYIGANILASFYLPASILLVLFWLSALVLPIREFFR